MMRISCGGDKNGFTLVEVLVYTAVFTVAAIFLLGILGVTTRVQVRQVSANEVNQQLTFVAGTIQHLVRDSSAIANPTNTPSSTLILRVASSTLDPTLVYLDPTMNALYIRRGSAQPFRITTDSVKVTSFSVNKFENPGGLAVVNVDLTLDYNSTSLQGKFTKTWKSAISRISAATFDGNLLPNGTATYDVGGTTNRWNNGYFASNVSILGNLGVGVDPSGGSVRIKSSGSFQFVNPADRLILVSPNGTCWAVGITNGGGFTTTSVACQ